MQERHVLEWRQYHHERKRRGQCKKEPERCGGNDADAGDVKKNANDNHGEANHDPAMFLGEPREHPTEIRHKYGRIYGHVENAGHEREPSFLKSPKISHGAPNPGVVTAFEGQSAGELANHKPSREAPEKRGQQQDKDGATVACAMNDVFRSIGSARHHEKSGGDERPEREADGFLLCRDSERLLRLGGRVSCCQFRWLPPWAILALSACDGGASSHARE